MNLPNAFTAGRIAITPLIAWLPLAPSSALRLTAFVLFIVAAVTDYVDGHLARSRKQETDLGRLLDPLADKLLLISGIVLLSFKNEPYLDRLPMWLTVTILSRDMLILIGMVVIHYICGRVTVRPALVGKMATVLQMTCVLWALLQWPARWLFIWALGAAICTGVSGMIYVYDGVRQLSASPSSSPAPDVRQ